MRAFRYSADGLRQTPLNENTPKVPRFFLCVFNNDGNWCKTFSNLITSETMKKLLIFVLSCCCLTACSSSYYQQIATLKSEQVRINDDGEFVAETPEFSISYNFWSQLGGVNFSIINKSDKDIYFRVSESYFIRNGRAYDYYQEIENVAATTTQIGNVGKISRQEVKMQKSICIPAHSYKPFKGFYTQPDVYRECGFIRNPSDSESAELNFNINNSPVIIENRLTLEIDGQVYPLNHVFYVSKLQNFATTTIVEYVNIKNCEGNSVGKKLYKMLAPFRYYIDYLPNYNELDRTKEQLLYHNPMNK